MEQPIIEQKEHEIAVAAFEDADQEMKDFIEEFKTGRYLIPAWNTMPDINHLMSQHVLALDHIARLVERRNGELAKAKIKLRDAIKLDPDNLRGPRGNATRLTVGTLKVESRTKRRFSSDELFDELRKLGKLDELMALKTYDKSGNEKSLVSYEWNIDFPNVLVWLEEHNLEKVIDEAYDEMESTAVVSGARPVLFLGEIK